MPCLPQPACPTPHIHPHHPSTYLTSQAEAAERTVRGGMMAAGVSLFGVDNELGMSGGCMGFFLFGWWAGLHGCPAAKLPAPSRVLLLQACTRFPPSGRAWHPPPARRSTCISSHNCPHPSNRRGLGRAVLQGGRRGAGPPRPRPQPPAPGGHGAGGAGAHAPPRRRRGTQVGLNCLVFIYMGREGAGGRCALSLLGTGGCCRCWAGCEVRGARCYPHTHWSAPPPSRHLFAFVQRQRAAQAGGVAGAQGLPALHHACAAAHPAAQVRGTAAGACQHLVCLV